MLRRILAIFWLFCRILGQERSFCEVVIILGFEPQNWCPPKASFDGNFKKGREPEEFLVPQSAIGEALNVTVTAGSLDCKSGRVSEVSMSEASKRKILCFRKSLVCKSSFSLSGYFEEGIL